MPAKKKPNSHTIAIGVGESGCQVASHLRSLSRKDGSEGHFRTLGIYSEREEIEEISKEKLDDSVRLTKPDIEGEESSTLLDSNLSERIGEDKADERISGRFYIDSQENFLDVYSLINSAIEESVSKYKYDLEQEVERYDIWILNSLDEAFGSGAFPIVGAIADHIFDNIMQDVERNDANIFGIGTFPWKRVDIEKYIFEKNVVPEQVNSYTALKDIEILTDKDKQHQIDVLSSEGHSGGVPDELRGGGSFDNYFLQPADRGKIWNENEREFTKDLQISAAVLPLYLSKLDGNDSDHSLEELEVNNGGYQSFRSVEIKIPYEKINKYINLDERSDEKERAKIREEFHSFKRRKRRIPLPIKNPEEKLKPFEKDEKNNGKITLKSLIDEGVISREHIQKARDIALGDILSSEPLLDIDTESGYEQNSYIGYLRSENNSDILKGNDSSYAVLMNEYDGNVDAEIGEERGIWLVGTYPCPDLDHVSEFRRIDDRYSEKEKDLTELFGDVHEGEITDEYVTERFAYPEFYYENELFEKRMKDKFY